MIETLAIIGTIVFIIMFFFSVWFNFYLIRKLLYFSENFDQISTLVEDFSNHLDTVHELPMFYGDESLQKLLEHSRALRKDLIDFQRKYSG